VIYKWLSEVGLMLDKPLPFIQTITQLTKQVLLKPSPPKLQAGVIANSYMEYFEKMA
jgi:hypothetical protein